MKSINVLQFSARLPIYVEEVQAGQTFIVSNKGGFPLAYLVSEYAGEATPVDLFELQARASWYLKQMKKGKAYQVDDCYLIPVE